MKKIILLALSIFILSMFSACSSSGDSVEEVNNQDVETLETKGVDQLVVYDVNGQEIDGAEVSIAPATSPSLSSSLVSINEIEDGLYKVTVTISGVTYSVTLYISDSNYQEIASLIVPVSYDPTDGSFTQVDATVGSISGTVYDALNVPIANAQVSISAGVATNGAYATAFTDEDGYYELIINVANSLSDDIADSEITVSADGYLSSSTSFEMEGGINSSGINFNLTTGAVQTTVEFDFESGTNLWTVNKLSGSNENLTWNVHTQSSVAVNKAYTDGNVILAPNDTSSGEIAAPANGSQCFWYGNATTTDDAYGSFIGSADASTLTGGYSSSSNSAELISPPIDLTSQSGDLRLGFKTWWEIESVNPNSSGYDLMTIAVSTDDGTTWEPIARLNPLSDPVSDLDKSPIPFSNTGFNSAPSWANQETISLVDADGNSVAGETIRIKFTFDTVDSYYNGFRGWMIDDLYIQEGTGTFPAFDDSFSDSYDDYYDYYDYNSELSTTNTAASLNRRR